MSSWSSVGTNLESKDDDKEYLSAVSPSGLVMRTVAGFEQQDSVLEICRME